MAGSKWRRLRAEYAATNEALGADDPADQLTKLAAKAIAYPNRDRGTRRERKRHGHPRGHKRVRLVRS